MQKKRKWFLIVPAIVLINIVGALLFLNEEKNLSGEMDETSKVTGELIAGYPFEVRRSDCFHINDYRQIEHGYIAVGFTEEERADKGEEQKISVIAVYNEEGVEEQVWYAECEEESVYSCWWNCVEVQKDIIVVAGGGYRTDQNGMADSMALIASFDLEGNKKWEVEKEETSVYCNYEYVDIAISDENKIYLCGSVYALEESDFQIGTLAIYNMNGELINDIQIGAEEKDDDAVNAFYDVSVGDEILVCGYEKCMNYVWVGGENVYSPIEYEVIYSTNEDIGQMKVLKRERNYD